jgi:cation diffusion facilitator family transporter
MDEHAQMAKKSSVVSGVANALMGAAKVVVGVIGHSPALLADGLHSFADVVCDVLVYAVSHVSHQEADFNHPYGHRRFETIATVALGILLVLLGVLIAISAGHRWLSGVLSIPSMWVVYVAVGSVLFNELLFWYMRAIGQRVDSKMIIANAWHNRVDALSSMAVLVGVLMARAGWRWGDPLAAMVVAAFIIYMGVHFSWKATAELTDEGVDIKTLAKLSKIIRGIDGVQAVHQLRTRKMADRVFLDVHVQVAPYLSVSEGHYVSESVEQALYQSFDAVADVTVHIDVEDEAHEIEGWLPAGRATIMGYVSPVFKAAECGGALDKVILHYLKGQIEVEVFMLSDKFKAKKSSARDLQDELERALTPISDEVKGITINFR